MSEQEVRDFWKTIYAAAVARGCSAQSSEDAADIAVERLKKKFRGY
jgi:hypothetical protein